MSENIPKGCCFFLSALLRPVECGAYSSGVSRKEKEIETQRPLRLERAQRVGGKKPTN
jgi:hypothetical protein